MRKLVSTPLASVFCFFLALAARFLMIRAFIGISSDKFALVLTTRNLLEGHGLNVHQVAMGDLSKSFYAPYIGWPPGYNLLLAPFLGVFKNDFMLATFLADISITVLFFVYLRKLLILIQFPVWAVNLFLVLQGFFIHPYITHSNPTDYIALTFLLAGIYHVIRLQTNAGHFKVQVLFIILFLSGAALSRYQYMPVVFVLPFLLWLSGILQKIKLWKTAGLFSFIALLAIVGGFLIYQKINAGTFVYQYNSEAGFFPNNLLLMYPLVAASVLNVDFYAMQSSLLFKTGYLPWHQVIHWLSMVSLAALVVLFIAWIIKKRFKPSSPAGYFIYFSTITALAVIALLFYMSLTAKAKSMYPLTGWTYVQEPRYYSFPALLVQVAAWWWLICGKGFTILRKYLRWIFMVVVAVEILHGAYILNKKYSVPMAPIRETFWNKPEISFTRDFIIENQEKENRQVVVTSLFIQFGFLADWFGANCIMTPKDLNIRRPKSSKPVILLVVIHEKHLPYFTSFLKTAEVNLVHQASGFNFYSLYVQPG